MSWVARFTAHSTMSIREYGMERGKGETRGRVRNACSVFKDRGALLIVYI